MELMAVPLLRVAVFHFLFFTPPEYVTKSH